MNQKRNHGYLLLQSLLEAADETIDFAAAFICAGYGASIKDLEIAKEKIHAKRFLTKQQQNKIRLEKKRFYDLIFNLEQSGLIEKYGSGKKKVILLTRFGKKKIEDGTMLKHSASYTKEISKEPIIFVFDIPEEERRKRDWLRSSLNHLGFRMIQKSVWVGSVKLPRSFLNDLNSQNLTSCVEILSINKSGTIKNIL